MVGSSRSGDLVSRMKTVSRAGSSSVFSSEFDPLGLSASAGSMMNTLVRPSYGRMLAPATMSRICSTLIIFRSPPTSTKCTSGCVRRSMRWHAAQSSPAVPLRQLSALATPAASARSAAGAGPCRMTAWCSSPRRAVSSSSEPASFIGSLPARAARAPRARRPRPRRRARR